MSGEPSVLPLSATITSPARPASRRARMAFSMQVASVSASFRQGMTMDTSGIGDRVVQSSPAGAELAPAGRAEGAGLKLGERIIVLPAFRQTVARPGVAGNLSGDARTRTYPRRRVLRRVGRPVDDVRGLEVRPHRVRRVREPAVRERIRRQEVAEFVGDDRLRHPDEERDRSACRHRSAPIRLAARRWCPARRRHARPAARAGAQRWASPTRGNGSSNAAGRRTSANIQPRARSASAPPAKTAACIHRRRRILSGPSFIPARRSGPAQT